ncbi:MAG: ABC transporter permease [Longimicrobiales bacterium]
MVVRHLFPEDRAMQRLIEDLRFALRQLRRSPGFALFVILTLAIGIGANTTIFGAVNAILLRPLPYADSDRLIGLTGSYQNRGDDWSVSLPNARDWGRRSHTFDGFGYYQGGSFTLAGQERPERLEATRASASLLPLLGARPLMGRLFNEQEDQPNGERVVVLSHALWQRRFAGDESVLGRSITLSGNPHVIIGVLPALFAFPQTGIEVYVPVRADETTWNRASGGLQVVAKLKSKLTLDAAQRDLDAVSSTLAQEFPGTNEVLSARLWTLRHRLYGGDETPLVLITLFGAVGFVLLIACVNVANLLLARATGREREMAVRTAIGASRRRVVRQLLTESVLLAVLGGAAGSLLSLLGTRLLLLAIPEGSMPRNIGMSGGVLAFTAAIALLTGILFGLAPAVQASRLDLASLMGGRSGLHTRQRARARATLVVAQVGLAAMLLIAAGLMIRSLNALLQTNPGFRTENLLTLRVSLDATYNQRDKSLAFQQQALQRLRALPGVSGAAAVDWLPLAGTNNYNDFRLEERRTEKSENAGTVLVTPGYIEAMGIQLVRGRSLAEQDVRSAPGAVLVNRAFAQKYFGERDPIGQRLLVGFDGRDPYPRTIVGIVGDVLHSGLAEDQRTEMYVPFAQLAWNFGGMTFVLRTRGQPLELLAAARTAIWAVDPSQAIYEPRTMQHVIDESGSVVSSRILAGALGIFGTIALLLAALGLYGVISYGVAQRTYEIGVRGALGATRSDVLRLIMGQGLTLVALGLALGLFGAFGATRLMSTLLHGVSAQDPTAFLQAVALLVGVALVATALPALRATRIDPAMALRAE